jgi:hypothetical protein
MENQINVGIQRQPYESFEPVDSEAENSNANASLADDSAGAHTGGNPNIISPHIDGESVSPAPPETVATNNSLNRYGIGDTVILGRPEYAMPDYNPVSNTTTASNSQHTESPPAQNEATSWMKEASISGSNDSGGSADGDSWDSGSGEGDYGGGGDVGGGDFDGGGDVGGGGDMGGGADANASTATNGSEQDSNCLPITGTDQNGNLTSNEATINITDKHPNNSHGGSPNDYSGVDSYGIGESALDADTSDTSLGATNSNDNSGMDSGSHGGASNDYLSVDGYGIGSGNVNQDTSADSTHSTTGGPASSYQAGLDAASQLLGKPQGTVSYDDVLGTLTQIRGASQNPELTMREQQALNSVFMAVYTRGNTERVIGPTVTNEFLNAAITSMMFGGSIARMPKPNSPTGPMLPGTTGNRTAFTLPSNGASETAALLAAAQQPFRGQTLTNAGRAATKHPEYFGFESTERMRTSYRTDAQINALANQSLQEILSNGVRTTGAGGRYPNGWITYTLPDGRAASWQSSGEFIGFRGVSK